MCFFYVHAIKANSSDASQIGELVSALVSTDAVSMHTALQCRKVS